MLFSNILLVSADKQLQKKIADIVADTYELAVSENFNMAIKIILKKVFALIVIDGQLEPAEWQKLLVKIKEYKITVPLMFVVEKNKDLLSFFSCAPQAFFVETDLDKELFLSAAQKILEKKYTLFENNELEERIFSRCRYGDFLGSGNYYELIINKIEKAIEQERPLLISGETGTEKELVAREIYKNSRFFSGHCFKKNISQALDDISYLYEINNGILLLEDLAELDLDGQKKLEALIDDDLVRVRLIMLSSLPLKKLTETRAFSPELLKIFLNNEIVLPPLRERIKDLPLLVDSYFSIMNEAYGFKIEGCTDGFLIALSKYSWPGNLRQLQSVIYDVVFRKKIGVVDESELPWFLEKAAVLI